MAINLTEDINHSGGGKIVSVAQSAGSWQSLATKATFSNFTANTTTKQNLSTGQFFYVLDEGQLYRLTVAGVGPFATFTLNSASFGDCIDKGWVTNIREYRTVIIIPSKVIDRITPTINFSNISNSSAEYFFFISFVLSELKLLMFPLCRFL